MKLRIIAGKLKRRVINVPSSSTDFRPTKEIVRESLSNSLNPRIRRAIVADICGGSGAFGFEMISRGASHCDFIEKSNNRCKNIQKHADLFNLERDEYSVICSDILKIVSRLTQKYDIIFYDPPYDILELAELVPHIYSLLKPGGILVYEREWKRDNQIPLLEGAEKKDVRKFGQTEIINWVKPVQ